MLKIDYEPLDVMTVLEVESQFDEQAFCEFYTISQDGLTLDVVIALAEPRVEISLQRIGEKLRLLHFSFWCGQIRRIGDGRGELLEFTQCIIGNIDLDLHASNFGPGTSFCSVHLWAKPHIRVEIT